MDIKLVVTDIDGTLIDHTETIPEQLVKTVEACKKKGIRFTLATGRTKELVNPIIEKLSVTEPCVIANGACIYRNQSYLVSHEFSVYPILGLIRLADQEGLTVTFSDKQGERSIRQTDYVRKHQSMGNRFQCYCDMDTMDWKHSCFHKVMFMDEHRTGKIAKYQKELREKFGEDYWVTAYSDMAVELGPKGCNKATGLHELIELLGIDMSQVMACGDFYNDMEMIQEAGIGVAVGNANSKLKAVADYTAEAEYCFGVIEAIDKYCF